MTQYKSHTIERNFNFIFTSGNLSTFRNVMSDITDKYVYINTAIAFFERRVKETAILVENFRDDRPLFLFSDEEDGMTRVFEKRESIKRELDTFKLIVSNLHKELIEDLENMLPEKNNNKKLRVKI